MHPLVPRLGAPMVEIGGVQFNSAGIVYNFSVGLGILVAILLLRRTMGFRAVPLLALTLFFGAYGSRVLNDVLFGLQAPWSPTAWANAFTGFWRGPGSVLGALAGGAVGVLIGSRLLRVPVAVAFDGITPGMAIAQSVGRWHCFLIGCCFGQPSELPWAIEFPATTIAGFAYGPLSLHPTQLYESLLDFILGLALLLVFRRGIRWLPTALYFVGYGAIRFVVQSFRGDVPFDEFGMTDAHRTAVLVIVAGLILLAVSIWKARSSLCDESLELP